MNNIKFASLISGGGTTMEAAIKAAQEGALDSDHRHIQFAGVIASNPDAKGISKAQSLDVPTFVIPRKIYKTQQEFGKKILETLNQIGANYVFQNGWLPLTPQNVIEAYEGRIFNQHPCSTDPEAEKDMDFGGKGMFGAAPTCARITYAWSIGEEKPFTESTIHHVSPDNTYDRGKIISVESLPLVHDIIKCPIAELEKNEFLQKILMETTSKVQKVLLPLEHQNVQRVIKHIAEHGTAPSFQRGTRLIPPENRQTLLRAKQLAIKLYPHG